jgi:RHS repeat-associated protein
VFDSDGRRIAEYNETSGALIREYVWNGWDPVAVIEGGVISFVRADHIGRPVFATNASGVKTWTDTYTPFGGVHTSTGARPSARFPGQWFQSESGLHQNWMRDYDPTTGRYLQADPLGLVDGASVYGYVRQSPMMLIDPRGEFAGLPGALAGALIGMAAGSALTGCIEGAFWGALTGAGIGFFGGGGVYGATGFAGAEAFAGQVIAYQFSRSCGCNKQEWDWRKATLISLGSMLGGGLGYGLNGGISGGMSSSPAWANNGGQTLGPILGGLVEGGLGEFGGIVGENMGTP